MIETSLSATESAHPQASLFPAPETLPTVASAATGRTAPIRGQRLTRAQFARQERVAKSTVTRWVQDGRITLGHDGLIDATAGAAERIATESPLAQHQTRKAQFIAEREATDQPRATDAATGQPAPPDAPIVPAPPSDSAVIGASLKYETYRLQKAKAELANLDIDKAPGLLVERAEIDFILSDFGATVRDQFESLPDRLTSDLAACRGDPSALHKTLADAARQALDTIDQHLLRRLAALS